MGDFFLKYYSELTKGFEYTALIIGLVTYRKYKNTPIKYFILFIFYSVFVEIGGSIPIHLNPGGVFENYGYLLKYKFFYSNYWWYGLFWTIGSVLFWSFFYQQIIHIKNYKTVLNFSTYVFVVCISIYTLIHIDQFFKTVLTFNKMFGSIIILIAIVLYFLNVLQSDIILSFYKSIYFYISMSLFFWWIITMPLYFYQKFVFVDSTELIKLISLTRLFANAIMYGTFTLALAFCKPEKSLHL
ncbi:hypothetical protein [uncultured Formosa sp.]|uniref:hypothetical protein n=1 Tax=uncultured Formosa sp. TaxID=255435 RepID=UPI00262E9E2A|nr:hypothetical protein [uncultured Formosa sp.]